jgi:hypothetical protein
MRSTVVLACVGLPCSGLLAADRVTELRLQLPPDAGPVVRAVAQVLTRRVQQRCAARVVSATTAPLVVELAVQPGVGTEGYEITAGAAGTLRITGNDDLGLLYGAGKFLRSSRYDQGGFTPGTWRGKSLPQCPFRAVYAATHFMNFYEAAPAAEVQCYVQDLGLWGANTLLLHFPTWKFAGFADPAARRNLEQIRRVLRSGKELGLKVGLVQCPNQGFASAPPAVRAKQYPDDLHRRGGAGVNCCPSQAEGQAYLLGLYEELFREFADIGLDYLVCWPYDEGGCGCQECWPWGAKGYVRISRAVGQVGRQANPHLKLVLSTWGFDTPAAGEWEGLAAAMREDPAGIDYIMADSHEDFPRYPLDVGVPGGLPLVNFPEISMWGRWPWGGYGANPLPARYQRLWDQTGGRLAGGMPYSEGIYEDMNYAICLQFYWDRQRRAEETLAEYLAFEYSPDCVDELLRAVRLLEETWTGPSPKSLEAYEVLQAVEKKLTPQARAAWRWRILMLRGSIDLELYRQEGKMTGPALQQAFDELTRLYHAEQAASPVRPRAVP